MLGGERRLRCRRRANLGHGVGRQLGDRASPNIHGCGHGLQMFGIDAWSDLAKVIELEPWGDRSDEHHVKGAMGEGRGAAHGRDAVAVTRLSALPDPARCPVACGARGPFEPLAVIVALAEPNRLSLDPAALMVRTLGDRRGLSAATFA